ncbi:hypothetical protein MMC12_007461 [Toensbergia leucococca]|nr:hypothetical protein [Toensbergia leucococca]
MSKVLQEFFSKVKSNFDVATKFKASHTSGSRMIPSRTPKNDADYELRIDAGELIANKRNLVLQVNSQAKSTAFKKWLQKHGAHANLATVSFDTTAIDPEVETQRALDELEEEAKANI